MFKFLKYIKLIKKIKKLIQNEKEVLNILQKAERGTHTFDIELKTKIAKEKIKMLKKLIKEE
ncbi:MAG: hypothetical protein BV457_00060 [Thermoplasmata archaeon M9B1D]|nr:MAG: hypothetical protein BV457_00060 [Thermoplasmata archaeon M9B1D]PNX52242.1 MAG: hypothetical protein BV456_00235 [Thermoplasmata archaeon M8B2D]